MSSSSSKSKSLPPKRRSLSKGRNDGQPEDQRKKEKETPEQREERQFQAKIRDLPEPERQRLLARRAKFTTTPGGSAAAAAAAADKVISLKAIREGGSGCTGEGNGGGSNSKSGGEEMVGDISLNVEDTLDMFEEQEEAESDSSKPPTADRERGGVRRDMREKLQSKKGTAFIQCLRRNLKISRPSLVLFYCKHSLKPSPKKKPSSSGILIV